MRQRRVVGWWTMFAIACAVPAHADHTAAHGAAGAGDDHAAHAAAADDHGAHAAPSAAAPMMLNDLGSFHRTISTRSPETQRWFDQGMRLTWAFNHDEAQRAFEQGAKIDTTCAMCWWGAAYALGPNINLPALSERAKLAYEYEKRALARLSHATPVEKDLIQALAKRYAQVPPADPANQARLDKAYADAMRVVAKRYPNDDDVQVLFAESMMDLRPWNFWTSKGQPAPGTTEIVSTLETVLARNPNHPGANHYYIHAVEASPHPEKALDAAKRIGVAMPGAGHLVHMPSHIYIRTGRYAESAQANRAAIQSDQGYIAKTGEPQGFYAMYVGHNHQFLWATAMMQGRSAESVKAARDAAASMPVEMLRQMPGYDFVLNFPIQALTRFGRWDDVLAEPAPPRDFSFATAMWHYARGRAYAAKGQLTEAMHARDSVAATLRSTPKEATQSLNSARGMLAVAKLSLDGAIDASRKRYPEAIRALRSAVAVEDTLHYAEPPDWYYPIRHQLGVVLLEAGQPGEAEAVYRKDLELHPENGWALMGLAKALGAQKGKEPAAQEVEKRFAKVWGDADVKIAASDY